MRMMRKVLKMGFAVSSAIVSIFLLPLTLCSAR